MAVFVVRLHVFNLEIENGAKVVLCYFRPLGWEKDFAWAPVADGEDVFGGDGAACRQFAMWLEEVGRAYGRKYALW